MTAEPSEREVLTAELLARIWLALEERRDLNEEQHHPRTQRILRAINPVDELVDRSDHQFIIGLVQKIVNKKGQRVWARYEERYLPFDPEELTEALKPGWVKAEDLKDMPKERSAVIIADQKAIEGRLKKSLCYDDDIHGEMLAFVKAKFEQQLARIRA